MDVTHVEGWRQRILVLSDTSDLPSVGCLRNTVAALSNARYAFDVHDLSGPLALPDLAGFSAVAVTTGNLHRLSPLQVRTLVEMVDGGGGLACLFRADPGNLAELLAIGEPPRSVAAGVLPAQSGGLRFPGAALPGFTGARLASEEMIGHAGHEQYPLKGAEVIAATLGGKPVAWSARAGAGRTAYWNSVFLGERRARGLIVQTIELVQAVSVTPCANAAVLQIDDFPAPLEPQLPEAVMAEFPGISPQEFHSRIWYRDMLDLARREGLKYSCYCIFDYVHPEGMDASLLDPRVVQLHEMAFEAVKNDPPAEIGLHGLNHNSLHHDFWPDDQTMRHALQEAADLWPQRGFGEAPASYVPPNNLYDEDGIDALASEIPAIRTVCGYFFGTHDTLGPREFGPEPWRPDLYCLPRISSGHECRPAEVFDALSQLAAFGVWTHFIHPDDVSDMPAPGTSTLNRRNPNRRPWRGSAQVRGLLAEFETFVQTIKAKAPWLAFRATSEAAEVIRAHMASRWEVSTQDDRLCIAGPEGGVARIRIDHLRWKRITEVTGCEILHSEIAGGRSGYAIQMTAPEAVLTLSETTAFGAVLRQARKALERSAARFPARDALTGNGRVRQR